MTKYTKETMTTYEKIRTIRNKRLPERHFRRPCGFAFYPKNKQTCKEDLEQYHCRCVQCDGTNWIEEPVTLQDILRMLNQKGTYAIASDGDIMNALMDSVIRIDLSKSIQDQDEEVLEGLLKIIE